MNLTPIPTDILDDVLTRFAAGLPAAGAARAAFDRIAESRHAGAPDTSAHRAGALALVRRLGMAAIDEPPAAAFSWDGAAVRTRSEASVLVHEAAHWLIAPPERRGLPDFGLGAGPETGRIEEADAACCVPRDVKIEEEQLASLLGILWEAELGHPAIHAFIEQNWLEAWDRPAAAGAFCRAVAALRERGLIGADGAPVLPGTRDGDSEAA